MQIEKLLQADGHAIAAYHWPQPDARRVLVIAHGMAEHAARYDGFAQFLNQQGCEVWALDHRGHGQSVLNGRLGHFADTDGWTKVVNDLAALVAHARQHSPGLPLVLFGHSMGSFVARALVLNHPKLVDGLVLSATGFRQSALARVLAGIAAVLGRSQGWDQPSAVMRKLVFGTFNLRFVPSRTAFDWLSRVPEEVDSYVADPLAGFDCSAGLWRDLFLGIVEMEALEARESGLPDVPVWLMAGSHDPVSMGGKGCRQLADRYQAAGLRDVNVTLYPQGRHEMLNERNRDEVYADFTAWLGKRFT
ncbi:lysophospholipase [Chitinimonas sp. PSY-7]|uniref:alpha/beta fold hydrolase n=1 Tax=Chitinimonas sp. PSY-7 TaxID=3459088 RepID=UPI00403FE686